MKNRVIHFEIQADDIERAKGFYTKAFSWNISQIMTADDKGNIDYWGLTTGSDKVPGINGGMYKRPQDKKIYTFDCTIEVENIDEIIEKIKMHGGRIDGEKMEIRNIGWFAKAIDTEGNIFGIIQSTKKTA